MQTKKTAPTLKAEQLKKVEGLKTVSDQMRYLDKEGYSRADIARILDKRYQHVKNVLDRPLKSA